MKRPYWLKLGLAPLLLAASLFSAPVGSMEQQRAAAHEQLSDASSLPAARLAPVAQVARLPVALRRLDHSPFHLPLHLAAGATHAPPTGPVALARRPDRADFRVPPLCERLPHDAIPPPALG